MDKKLDLNIKALAHLLLTKAVITDNDRMIVTGVVGSTGIIDRQGESINPQGWKLENYKNSPVILYGHDYGSFPIGKALNVYYESGSLKFDIEFAQTDEGKKAFYLIANGFLNTVSVGFMPLKYAEDGQYTYDECELLELSVVPVPANPQALIQTRGLKKEEETEVVDAVKTLEEAREKAGRKLSAKNEAKIKEAHKLLNEVIEESQSEDDEKQLIITDVKALTELIEKAVEVKVREVITNYNEEEKQKIVDAENKTKEEIKETLKEVKKEVVSKDKKGEVILTKIKELNVLLNAKSSTEEGGEK